MQTMEEDRIGIIKGTTLQFQELFADTLPLLKTCCDSSRIEKISSGKHKREKLAIRKVLT